MSPSVIFVTLSQHPLIVLHDGPQNMSVRLDVGRRCVWINEAIRNTVPDGWLAEHGVWQDLARKVKRSIDLIRTGPCRVDVEPMEPSDDTLVDVIQLEIVCHLRLMGRLGLEVDRKGSSQWSLICGPGPVMSASKGYKEMPAQPRGKVLEM